jgi:phenylacetate-CoA ligase
MEEIEHAQARYLPGQLKYCYDNSELYKKKFDDLGVRPEEVKTLDDLRRLPIMMTKDDERKSHLASLEKYGHPFGMHLCAPPEDVYLTGTTSGTTGVSTFTYTFTQQDMENLAPTLGFQFASVGIEKGDRVMFCFALGIYATSMGLWGLRHIGALPIDIDVRAGSEMMLRFAQTTRASWLLCTPSLALYLAEKAPAILGKEVRDLGFKGLKLTGEPWASIPEVKSKIEALYGCRAYDFYAVCGVAAGVSCDSDEYHGLHCHAPHLCTTYQDLVDPMTKKPIDITDGAVGEIVVTMLQRKACPLVKYAYGDIVQIFTGECPGCGFKGPRVKIVGRADDMLIVKGSNVYPAAIKKVVAAFMPRVTGEMRIVLDQPPPRVEPPLKLRIEHGEDVGNDDLDGLAEAIGQALHNKLKVRPAIEWLQPGTLEKSKRKSDIFVKEYLNRQGS